MKVHGAPTVPRGKTQVGGLDTTLCQRVLLQKTFLGPDTPLPHILQGTREIRRCLLSGARACPLLPLRTRMRGGHPGWLGAMLTRCCWSIAARKVSR